MRDVYLVSCCRTAIGSFGGSLKDVPAVQLGSTVAKETLERAKLNPQNIDEVVFGCVLTTGMGQNMARQVSVNAGIPVEVPAYTVGMVCGSGMKSIIEAARAIQCGDADVILAGGAENMSAAPYAVNSVRFGARMNNTAMVDTMIHEGLWDAFNDCHMGITAENVCDEWRLTREDLDDFALQSQNKAAHAIQNGKFAEEIVPIVIEKRKERKEFTVDEFPRKTSAENLAKLKAVFKKGGKVTAGNASGINDGAAAVLVASKEAVDKYGLKPMAKLVSWGQGGVDPKIMGMGPVPASQQALEKAGLRIEDIDLIEANEAFASQSLAVAKELKFDMEKVNVNGGSIALGHPVGASGARIIVTLVHEMKKRQDAKYGLATLCIGGGMGLATIWEKVS